MTLRNRLAKLEQHRPGRRCAHCKDWREHYVTMPDDWIQTPYSCHASQSQEAYPGRCPVCGFEPTHVVVEYVDWREGHFRDAS
jgi:hypothetical protein